LERSKQYRKNAAGRIPAKVFRRRRAYRSKNYPRAGLSVSAIPLERPHRNASKIQFMKFNLMVPVDLRTYMSLAASPFP
jgi:hypothetical protein